MLGFRKVLYCLESIILDYGTNMKKVRNQIRNQSQGQAYYHVHTQVSDKIICQVWDQVNTRVVNRVWELVYVKARGDIG